MPRIDLILKEYYIKGSHDKMVSTRCNVKAVDHENIFYSHVRKKFVFVFPYKEQCICISIQRTKKWYVQSGFMTPVKMFNTWTVTKI